MSLRISWFLVFPLSLWVLSANAQFTCDPPPSGLISWWAGDGNALDLEGVNNGTLVNGATFAPGEVGQAFSFNGADQYVQIADSPSLRPSSVTLECWFNDSNTGGGNVISKPVGSGDSDSYAIWLTGGNLNGSVGNTSAQPFISYGFTPVPGVWYHTAYTFDNNTQTQTLYLNGAVVATGTTSLQIGYDTHPVLIGTELDSGSPDFPWTGEIDEVSIYNRALSSNEIAAIYAAYGAGKCKEPDIVTQPANQTATVGNSVTFTVSANGPVPLSYQWLFNGTNLTNNGQITGSQSSTLSLTGITMASAGTYEVVVTNAYGSASALATLAVNQAAPIITWGNPAPIVYGTALSSSQLDATANVPGSFAYTPTNDIVLDAGTNTLTAVFTPTDTVDYTSATNTVGLVVSPAPLTVTASNANRTEGQTNPVFSGTISGLTNNDNITATYSTTATISSPAGTYPIVPSLVDPNNREGNYVVTLTNGTLTVYPLPVILTQPQDQVALVDTKVTLIVAATNTPPSLPQLGYQWQFDGTNMASATNAVLSFPSVSLNQAGSYQVVVTGTYGAVTSSPALLDVRPIFVSTNSVLLTGTNYTFIGPTPLTLVTGFTNGSIYYTLDGTQPSFLTSYYQSPITVGESSLLRAIAYSADFSEDGEMPPIAITIIPVYSINYLLSPGGTVSASPSNSPYVTGSQVTLQATPNPGWTFLYWLGDSGGGATNVTLTMDSDKTVQAVFGTTLSETVAGNGTVTDDPSSPLYPYGTTVRLTGNPASGNAFGTWGNAAAGISTNPLYFTITNPTPIISALFSTLPGNKVSLTIQTIGNGRVRANPVANAYTLNSIVALTAIPVAGQQFLGWSGAASGSSTNFSLTMNQSKTVIATFSEAPSLSVAPPLNGLFDSGFRLTITSDFGAVCDLEASTNLPNWYPLATLTNTYGTTEFTDPGATSNIATFYRAILPQ